MLMRGSGYAADGGWTVAKQWQEGTKGTDSVSDHRHRLWRFMSSPNALWCVALTNLSGQATQFQSWSTNLLLIYD